MKSPQGKNYSRMMDLQNQAIRYGGFDKGDPRINELKDTRRKYNRHDKYGIANLLGYSDQVANEIYRQNSGVLREHARPTYKTMYPISDMAHAVTGSGGLTGMLLNKAFGKSKKAGTGFFKDLRQMGADIFEGIGIGGAVPRDEATQEILENYADQTFGHTPLDVHPELHIEDEIDRPWKEEEIDIDMIPPRTGVDVVDDITVTDQMPGSPFFPGNLLNLLKRPEVIPGYETTYIDEPWPYEDTEVIEETTKKDGNLISDELWDSIRDFDPSTIGAGGEIHAGEGIIVPPWLLDPSLPMPPELLEGEYPPGEYHDELIEEAPPPIPRFDDSSRESGIAALYGHGPKEPVRSKDVEDYQRQMNKVMEKYGHDRRFTYDQVEEIWKRKHTLPRGLHEDERPIPYELLEFYAKYPELRRDDIPSDYPDQINRIR